MNWFIGTIVAVSVGILALAGILAWHWPAARRRTLVGAFAGSRSLVLDAEAAALAERLLIAGRKGRVVGAAAAVAVAMGAWVVLDEAGGLAASTAWLVVHNVGSQIAATLAAAVAMRRAAAQHRGAGPRYAHLPPASLDDVLPPLMRWWSAGLLGLATVGTAVCLAAGVDVDPLSRSELAVCLAVSSATVGAAELAARFLARAPLPARSPAALAVCDEVRSDLATVVLAGMLGPMLLSLFVASRILPEAGIVTVVLLVLPVAVMEQRRRRRVRERLWPAAPIGAGAGPAAEAPS